MEVEFIGLNVGHYAEGEIRGAQQDRKESLAVDAFASMALNDQVKELQNEFIQIESISADDRANFEQFMNETYFELIYSGVFDLLHVIFASDSNGAKFTLSEKIKIAAYIIKGEIKGIEFFLKSFVGIAEAFWKKMPNLKPHQKALTNLNKWLSSIEAFGYGAKLIWAKVVLSRTKKEYLKLRSEYLNNDNLTQEEKDELKQKFNRIKNFMAESEVNIESMQTSIVLKGVKSGVFVAAQLFKGILTVIDKTTEVGKILSKATLVLGVVGTAATIAKDIHAVYRKFDEIRLHDQEIKKIEEKFKKRIRRGEIPEGQFIQGTEFSQRWDQMLQSTVDDANESFKEIFQKAFGFEPEKGMDAANINTPEMKQKVRKMYMGKSEVHLTSVEPTKSQLGAHLARMKIEDEVRLEKLRPEFNKMWDEMLSEIGKVSSVSFKEVFKKKFGFNPPEDIRDTDLNDSRLIEKMLKRYHNHLQTLEPLTKQALEQMSIKKHEHINRFLTVEMAFALGGVGLSLFGLTIGIIALVSFPPGLMLLFGGGILMGGLILIVLGGVHAVVHRPNYAKEQYLKQGMFIRKQILNFRKKVKAWEKARFESRKARVLERGSIAKLEIETLKDELTQAGQITEEQRKRLRTFIQVSSETTAKEALAMLTQKEDIFKKMMEKHVRQMAGQIDRIDEKIQGFDRRIDLLAEKLVDASWTDYIGRWNKKGLRSGLEAMPPTVARLLKEGYISDELKEFYTETFGLNIEDLSAKDQEKLKDSLEKEVKRHFGEATEDVISALKKKRKKERIQKEKMKFNFEPDGPKIDRKAA